MNTGTESPQWAKDLIGHWVIFHDYHHGIPDMKAFVFMTDFFPSNPLLRQVRIFADPYENVVDEITTGKPMLGLYATDWEGEPHNSEEGEVKWLTAEEVCSTKAAFGDYNRKTLNVFKQMFPNVYLKGESQ